MPTTHRQRRGSRAEQLVAEWLHRAGWRIVSRNLRAGRDEIDIVGVDPGPPVELVAVEVRSAATVAFGAPEERVDRSKVARMYRALAAAVRDDRLPPEVTRLSRRVDLVVVDGRSGRTKLRHMRSVEPP